jgi:DNA gyrase subunit A
MLALNGGRPELMDLKAIIAAFVDFREEVITRRTAFELNKARDRAHVLVGLAIAVANIDPVIALIRAAPDPVTAREQLMARDWPAEQVAPLIALIDEPGRAVAEDGTYRLSEAQARAILELRLQRLTGLEREKIAEELEALAAQIREYLETLRSRPKLLGILRDELLDMKERFATPRRTEILDDGFEHDDEDLIQREDMVMTVTHAGYIKRVPLSAYRAQRRGGKGRSGMATRDEDFVSKVFVCNTHTPVLFFSSRGMVYQLKVYRLPVGTPQSRGKALVNLLPLQEGETITTFMPMPEDEASWDEMFVVFATTRGEVRRNKLSDFTNVKSNGKIAMKFEDEESRLVAVRPCSEDNDVLLSTAKGKCIRFPISDVRVFSGRTSTGVRGIRLAEGDHVIAMALLDDAGTLSTEEREAYLRYAAARRREENAEAEEGEAAAVEMPDTNGLSEERLAELSEREQFILSVSADGYGKRSSAYDYRRTGRGGQGVGNMDLTRGKDEDSTVVGALPITESEQIMLITDCGKLIRTPVHDVRIAGRTTRGVTLFRIGKGERVVSVTRLAEVSDDEDVDADGEALSSNGAAEADPSGED